jgi:hypothetical protein
MNSDQLWRSTDFPETEAQAVSNPGFGLALSADDPPDSLERRIRRRPTDLNAHVQRIRSYQTLNNAPGCYAALADLFIVLGPRGFNLRKRMMDQSAFLLTPYLRKFLDDHLDIGISARTPLPCVTSSILTEAISGTTELVAGGTPDSSFQ